MDPFMQVSVTLISGHGLQAADSNGKSDPYAKLHLGKHSHTSHTKYKTLDPEWGEEFFWKGKKGPLLAKPLRIQLYDHDMISFDDPLGGVNIDLLPLIEKMAEDEVKETIRDLDTQGSVRLKISWRWCGRSRSNDAIPNHARDVRSATTVDGHTVLVTRCPPVGGRRPPLTAVRWRVLFIDQRPLTAARGARQPAALCAPSTGGRSRPRSSQASTTCSSGIGTSGGLSTSC